MTLTKYLQCYLYLTVQSFIILHSRSVRVIENAIGLPLALF